MSKPNYELQFGLTDTDQMALHKGLNNAWRMLNEVRRERVQNMTELEKVNFDGIEAELMDAIKLTINLRQNIVEPKKS